MDLHSGKAHKLSPSIRTQHCSHTKTQAWIRRSRIYTRIISLDVRHTQKDTFTCWLQFRGFGLKALTGAKPGATAPSPRPRSWAQPGHSARHPRLHLASTLGSKDFFSFQQGERRTWCGGHWGLNGGAGEVKETASRRGSSMHPSPTYWEGSRKQTEEGKRWEGRTKSGRD